MQQLPAYLLDLIICCIVATNPTDDLVFCCVFWLTPVDWILARSEGLRAVLPLAYGGVLTGGSDACVRLWDGQEPKQSYVVCGPSATDRTSKDVSYHLDAATFELP